MLATFVSSLRLELLVQLSLAVLLGGVVGLERELKGKPAGLRTNILICIGATLFTTLSIHLAGPHGDPARLAAQILPGVGFIGAGTILHTRGAVTGLTSAATIWVVAAIGVALGSGAYVEAFGTTVLVMVVLQGLGPVERWLARYAAVSRVLIHARPQAGAYEEILEIVRRAGAEIATTTQRKEGPDDVIELELRGPRHAHDQVRLALVHHSAVRSVSTGE
jgi:putative Mg2+ transporter-C (MgtC) family protein